MEKFWNLVNPLIIITWPWRLRLLIGSNLIFEIFGFFVWKLFLSWTRIFLQFSVYLKISVLLQLALNSHYSLHIKMKISQKYHLFSGRLIIRKIAGSETRSRDPYFWDFFINFLVPLAVSFRLRVFLLNKIEFQRLNVCYHIINMSKIFLLSRIFSEFLIDHLSMQFLHV